MNEQAFEHRQDLPHSASATSDLALQEQSCALKWFKYLVILYHYIPVVRRKLVLQDRGFFAPGVSLFVTPLVRSLLIIDPFIALLLNEIVDGCTEFYCTLGTVVEGIPPSEVVFDELKDSAIALVSYILALDVFEGFNALQRSYDILDNVMQSPCRPFLSPSPKLLFLYIKML